MIECALLLQLTRMYERAGFLFLLMGGYLAPQSRARPNAAETCRCIVKSNTQLLAPYFTNLDENDHLALNGFLSGLLISEVHAPQQKDLECASAAL
jgi:hypothetical protein